MKLLVPDSEIRKAQYSEAVFRKVMGYGFLHPK
jgi:hypothetical protein